MHVLKFCPSCGEDTLQQHCLKSLQCAICQCTLYLNPAAGVGAIITCGADILLAVRGQEPCAGKLDIPGGFVDYGETAEQALARELKEELNLDVDIDLEMASPTYFCSFPNTYPYRGIVYQTLDFFFLIPLHQKPVVRAGDDVAAYVWMRRADLSLEEIAFASGRQALFEYGRMTDSVGVTQVP
jgi:ADP-ribose pyrophosphatase YjhB (NUDIX family)